jgi:lipid-A-disaccharide synthase
VILPFEEAFFRNVGVEAHYVGHPLLDQGAPPTRTAARASLGIGVEERVLAMFPGSRTGEIRRLWPAMQAALTLPDRGIATRIVEAATDQPARAVTYPGSDRFMMVRGNALGVLAAADAGIVKSGTSTLEAALTDTPMVVPYKVNAVTAFLTRRLVTVSGRAS